eukprot:14355046-Ditylum_brightwellii.AAC.1
MIPWPNQGMPPESCWVIWRRFSKKYFAPDTPCAHRLSKPIRLQQQLGAWLTETPYTACEFYHSLAENQVYHLQNGSFNIYSTTPGRFT